MRAVLLLLLFALDPAFVKTTVESIGAMISKEYFDPTVGAAVDTALKRSLAEGRYADAADDQALATLLNRDLFAATHDKHLNLEARRDVPAERERSVEQADEAQSSYWYFCPTLNAYYPAVQQCPSGWLRVLPPPAAQ